MNENSELDYNAELDKYIEQLKSCKYIQDDRAVKKLCEKAKELLLKEENIIYLNAPITVRKKNFIKYKKIKL
jgi:serine/threonine-protein phosphatase 4 catalytic subunit